MTIVAGIPSRRAAMATPCAWLPDEKATTPRLLSASPSRSRRLVAPRSLKLPPCCRHSAFTQRRVPSQSSGSSGVRVTWPATRSAAARTPSAVGLFSVMQASGKSREKAGLYRGERDPYIRLAAPWGLPTARQLCRQLPRWRSLELHKLHSALGLAAAPSGAASGTEIAKLRPVQPVTLIRPHAARRAARFFIEKFPGRSLYAVKANPSTDLLKILWTAGVTHYDVASIGEIRLVHEALPEAVLCFMHPVKAEEAIAEAYFDHGVKTFSLDTIDELEKIVR